MRLWKNKFNIFGLEMRLEMSAQSWIYNGHLHRSKKEKKAKLF
jgi:hypothetical protein